MCTKGQLASKRTAVTKAAPYSLIPDLLLCHACFCFNFNNSQINIIFAIVSKTKTIKNNLARSKKETKKHYIYHTYIYVSNTHDFYQFAVRVGYKLTSLFFLERVLFLTCLRFFKKQKKRFESKNL